LIKLKLFVIECRYKDQYTYDVHVVGNLWAVVYILKYHPLAINVNVV